MPKTSRAALIAEIAGELMRRHSTAAILLHHAVAEHLGLRPTDHKCLDIIRQRGPITGSELASITGLTTGAITGVVARLETADLLNRQPHPDDARKQFLVANKQAGPRIAAIFEPTHRDLEEALATFDRDELDAIRRFLVAVTAISYRHVSRLRGEGALVAQPASRQ